MLDWNLFLDFADKLAPLIVLVWFVTQAVNYKKKGKGEGFSSYQKKILIMIISFLITVTLLAFFLGINVVQSILNVFILLLGIYWVTQLIYNRFQFRQGQS